MAVARIFTLSLAAVCCVPMASLLWLALSTDGLDIAPAIFRFVPGYVTNSLLIALGTGSLSLLIGCSAAWAVTRYHFPYRRVVSWALLLPLAVPSYLLAMVYGHWLDVAGPLQAALRSFSGLNANEMNFPPVRSLGGVIAMLALSLYPYVYIAARAAFAGQCQSHFEAAWLAGVPPRRWLWCVALPIARPALALGVALVMMESLADFGVVALFGVPSFTTGIYRAWYGLGEPEQAARLALMLLAMVMVIIAIEKAMRGRLRHMHSAPSKGMLARFEVSRLRAITLCVGCALPVLLGFVLPLLQLMAWAFVARESWLDALHWRAAYHAVMIASMVALGAMVLAWLFSYALREGPSRWQTAMLRVASLGYAIPGSVIAVAIFIPLLGVDKNVASWWAGQFGERPSLWVTGSIAAIVIACTIRFLAVALANVEAGLQTISPQLDDAAKLLGARTFRVRRELHWPQLKWMVFAGGFMVFADTLKELPASLLLRPFNVSTLSIRTYELASDGQLVQASVPALMMIIIGVLAVWLLIHLQIARKPHHGGD